MRKPKERTIKALKTLSNGEKHINMYKNMLNAHDMMVLADNMTPLTMHPKGLEMNIVDGGLQIHEHGDVDYPPQILVNVMMHQILDMYIALYETIDETNINNDAIRQSLDAMHDAIGSFGRMAFSNEEQIGIGDVTDKLGIIKDLLDDLMNDGEVVYKTDNAMIVQKRASVDDESELEGTIEINIDAMLRALDPSDEMEAMFIKQLEMAKEAPDCVGVRTERLPDNIMQRYEAELAKEGVNGDNLDALLGDD